MSNIDEMLVVVNLLGAKIDKWSKSGRDEDERLALSAENNWIKYLLNPNWSI